MEEALKRLQEAEAYNQQQHVCVNSPHLNNNYNKRCKKRRNRSKQRNNSLLQISKKMFVAVKNKWSIRSLKE